IRSRSTWHTQPPELRATQLLSLPPRAVPPVARPPDSEGRRFIYAFPAHTTLGHALMHESYRNPPELSPRGVLHLSARGRTRQFVQGATTGSAGFQRPGDPALAGLHDSQ